MTTQAVQSLVIPGWLPEQLANSHLHWRVHRKRHHTARDTVWAYARQAGWQPVKTRARLTIVLVFPRKYGRGMDADNAVARCKGAIDGLKPWIVDDSTDWLELDVRAIVEPGVRETRITLEEVPA